METKTKDGKPRLHLLRGKGLTAEKLASFYERLTGRKATPEEIVRARKALAG